MEQSQAEQASNDDFGVALVLGSEGQGVSQEILDACHCVSIPMAGDMESLNVAVAGSILMWALSKGAASFIDTLITTGGTLKSPLSDR